MLSCKQSTVSVQELISTGIHNTIAGLTIVCNTHFSASLMCASLTNLKDDIQSIEVAGIDSFHLDIMDGHFVPNLTFGPDFVKAVRSTTSLPLHAHLMIDDPSWILEPLAQAGCDVCIFHIEAERYPHRLIQRIRDLGMSPGIAINPSTPVTAIAGLDTSYLLIMTVEPGFAGQRWLPLSGDRIREAHALVDDNTIIAVDGNVSLEHAREAVAAGATMLVLGTSVLFGTGREYAVELKELRSALESAS